MVAMNSARCTAFEGARRIASGELAQVALKVKAAMDRDERAGIVIFDDATSEQVELDLRGSVEDVLKRLASQDTPSGVAAAEQEAPRRPGRPKLGVVAREVTLLPRHWDWLNSQPGGASIALRKLVEDARRRNEGKDRIRRAQEATYRFMSAMAGNERGFEEAARALFAGNQDRFEELVEAWPVDLREHAKMLAAVSFQERALENAKAGSGTRQEDRAGD